jgi:hypothetical protein
MLSWLIALGGTIAVLFILTAIVYDVVDWIVV